MLTKTGLNVILIDKILALRSGNNGKCEFLTGKDVLPERDLLDKEAIMKTFEYSPLGSELKKQTSIAEKQYQELDKVHRDDTKLVTKKKESSNLVCNSLSFNKFNVSYEEFFELSEDKKNEIQEDIA